MLSTSRLAGMKSTTFAVLGTGESMSQAVAETVRGRCNVVAVSDAYRLAPWADALVSHDPAWWSAHPQALRFAGRRFCGRPMSGAESIPPDGRLPRDCNSGLDGMRVAYLLGARRILLLGFDMRGTHFFGTHPTPLRNTMPGRFQTFMRQFEGWNKCPVLNCTPGSALMCFPMSTLERALSNARSNAAAMSGVAQC